MPSARHDASRSAHRRSQKIFTLPAKFLVTNLSARRRREGGDKRVDDHDLPFYEPQEFRQPDDTAVTSETTTTAKATTDSGHAACSAFV